MSPLESQEDNPSDRSRHGLHELKRRALKRTTEKRLHEAGVGIERSASVKDGTKECYDHGDQNAPTNTDGNYSVHAGDELILLDVDVPIDELPEWIANLPSTFVVRTPHSGYHLYYKIDADERISNTDSVIGSIRYEGYYCVGPGSTIDHEHCPDGKNDCPGEGIGEYTVECDNPIATLSGEPLDKLRAICDSNVDNESEEFEQAETFRGLPEPDEDLVAAGEANLRDLQAITTGLAFNDLMDLLRGGTGSIDNLRREDDTIDRNKADSEALWLLYGAMRRMERGKDRSAELAYSIYSQYCLKHPYGKDGRKRKWLIRNDSYRRRQLRDAICAFDVGKWRRWLRRTHSNPDSKEPLAFTNEYSQVTYDVVDAAVSMLAGVLPLEQAARAHDLDVSSLPDPHCHKILTQSNWVTYADFEQFDFPEKEEIIALAQDLDPSRSEATHEAALKRLISKYELVKRARMGAHKYVYYPAFLQDPSGACYIEIGGEQLEPKLQNSKGDSESSKKGDTKVIADGGVTTDTPEKPYRDERKLRKFYVEKEMTQQAIADEWGCGRNTIYRWLNEYDIPRHQSDWTSVRGYGAIRGPGG